MQTSVQLAAKSQNLLGQPDLAITSGLPFFSINKDKIGMSLVARIFAAAKLTVCFLNVHRPIIFLYKCVRYRLKIIYYTRYNIYAKSKINKSSMNSME